MCMRAIQPVSHNFPVRILETTDAMPVVKYIQDERLIGIPRSSAYFAYRKNAGIKLIYNNSTYF
jgi:hypothetical protein